MAERFTGFQWQDYLVMALVIAICIAIGIFFGWRDRKKSKEDYLVASRKLSWWPVGVSILVTFQSTILLIGVPAEVYTYGFIFILFHVGMGLAVLLCGVIFVPLLYPLKLTSVYEYLERRFESRTVRIIGSFIGALNMCLYSGVVIFGPAIALEAMVGFQAWATILILGVTATLYTALGGIKAVIWTDAFQCLIMTAGLLAILIKGMMLQGGIHKVWETATIGGRTELNSISPDPRVRHTVWSLIIGGTFTWLANIGVNQANVQRFSSVPTLNAARLAVFASGPAFVAFGTVSCLSGLVLYSYFKSVECDPLVSKTVGNPNQIVPLFFLDIFGFLPGLSGMFTSAMLCASLSTVSSNINSLSAMLWEDVFKGRIKASDSKQTAIIKGFALLFGAILTAVGIAVLQIGGPATQIAASFFGVSGGPLLGMFILGAFFPWANWIGVSIGAITSLAFCLWISSGAYTIPKSPILSPAPTSGCDTYLFGENSTTTMYTTDSTTAYTYTNLTTEAMYTEVPMTDDSATSSALVDLYSISYLWYSLIGILWVIIVGIILSLVTGATDPTDIDEELLISYKCCKREKTYDISDKKDITYAENGGYTDSKSDTNGKLTNGVHDTEFNSNKL